MKIPKKIMLFNRVYKVKMVKKIEKKEDKDGAVYYDRQEINILRGMPADYTWRVFLHELDHLIDDEYAMDLTEENITRMANGLDQVLSNLIKDKR